MSSSSKKRIRLTPNQRLALEELARRRGILPTPGSFRLEDYLFDKQLAFVRDPSRSKLGVTTRRAGKTISCVADLTYAALASPHSTCLYITLSRANAKRLVWPEFKKLNERFQLSGKANESELSMQFPNGSKVYLAGAKDRTTIEDFRGLAIKLVYIDEAQSFPAYIAELVNDVLRPALMDHAGQLVLIGTPGPLPSGYFFDLTNNKHWSQHGWSFFDNPKLPFLQKGISHQDELNMVLATRGVTAADPSIQREYYGRWVMDENSLVYKYNPRINHYDQLPTAPDWTFIMGVDLGFDDADAIAVLAYSDTHPETYLLEELVTAGQDISALAEQVERLRKKYGVTKIVVDTGALGKKITEELSKRFSIPMVPAEKTRKVEFIELMNDALRTGKLRAKHSSRFAQDAQKVEWDWDKSTPDRKVISDRFHSDICEAVLYAWRESYSFTNKAKAEEPTYGTAAWSSSEADKMFQHEVDRAEAQAEELGMSPEPPQPPDLDELQRLDRPKGRYEAMFKRRRGPA